MKDNPRLNSLFYNSIFYSINSCQMKRLQTIQNALACPRSHENSQTSPHNSCPKITALAKRPSTHPLQNCFSYLQYSSNISTFLHTPNTHHPLTRVYSRITIYFSISVSSLFLSEVLQPLLSPCCTNSLERTPQRPPSVCAPS